MDLQPYFDAILAAPDDDAPRLRLADALIAAGDLRGESIRLACEIEHLELDDPARLALVERRAKLPCFYYFTLNPSWNNGFVARRGFVDEVQWKPAHFVAHGDALLRAAPVRTLSVLGGLLRGDGALLGRAPALARLRKLVVPPVHNAGDELVALGRSPHLAGLHTLRVDNLTLDRGLVARFERERAFPGLRALELVRCTVAPDAWPALLSLLEARGVTALDLTATRVPEATEKLLRARLGHVTPRPPIRGTSPDELRARVRFGTLDLSNNGLDAKAFAALVASGPYPTVRALVLRGNTLGDAGVEALARSGGFPSLASLMLDGAGVTLEAARSLAGATGLDALAMVSLGEVVQTANDGGLGRDDGAALELARSPALPALRELHFARTWRAYAEGAREEAVTQQVQRDDGAVVECVIHHWIWP